MDFKEDSDSESSNTSEVELENELYSVYHYNDFSQGVPNHLLEKYDIEIKPNNEITISVKDSNGVNEKEEQNRTVEQYETVEISSDESVKLIEHRAMKRKRSDSLSNRRCKKSVKYVEVSDSEGEDLILNTSVSNEVLDVSDVIQSKYTWNEVESPKNWTKSMRKYYNGPSDSLRFFDHKRILFELRKDQLSKWEIDNADKFHRYRPARRCYICNQVDHGFKDCPKKDSRCAMCGHPGHRHDSCPYSICLNCGSRAPWFIKMCSRCISHSRSICFSCKQIGHEAKNCPDIWRQFHSTIGAEMKSTVELNPRLHCSNCSSSGHLYENCSQLFDIDTPYPPTSLIVKKYSNGAVNDDIVLPRSSSNDRATNQRRPNATDRRRSPHAKNRWQPWSQMKDQNNRRMKRKLRKNRREKLNHTI